jgi:prepilin-type N-terminal cleavage/methylation domain-containing protein
MKTLPGKGKVSGLTLIELLVVIAVIAILAALLLPPATHSRKARIPWCMNNLKQIDLGFLMYEGDNNGKFPMQFSTTNGGTMEFIRSGSVFPHIQKLSQYFGQNTQILICPSDVERHAATNFETLNDLNISYFLNADVSTNNPSLSILAGDRNLEAVNQPVKSGLFVLTTNIYMRWTDNLHTRRGCLSFADGHVQLVSINLNSIIRNQPLATNRLCVP